MPNAPLSGTNKQTLPPVASVKQTALTREQRLQGTVVLVREELGLRQAQPPGVGKIVD